MKFLRLLFVLCLPGPVLAQLDSAMSLPLIGIHLGGQLPGADMVKRFGPNLEAGGLLAYKTNRNYIFGLDINYLFSRNVKEDVLKNLKNEDGFITDNDGYPADLRITQRGVALHLVAGKVFTVKGLNRNSGFLLMAGVGYMQHKINLYDAQQRVAAVKEELKHGYDRMSVGPSFSQFAGYLNLSDNRLLNFYIGIQAYQAFTKSVRKLNYDTGLSDTQQRLDVLTGLRIGWILPLYKKKPRDFYYN